MKRKIEVINLLFALLWYEYTNIIGGSRGAPLAHAPPPNRIQFFRFHIHFCQKVPMSEVGAPPTARRPPQGEILDPPLTM